ncbi:MAG: hypothetical protein KDH96_09975 [Candidatus Riesia sp.]|nr:hypothetical protein [Candidatus Riesia sp.]
MPPHKYTDATSPKPKSKNQCVGTDRRYIRKIMSEFNIVYDLAASRDNAIVPKFITKEQNSLTTSWSNIPELIFNSNNWGWLNPEYQDIMPWAKKCAQESLNGVNILMLVPASVGSKWYAKWVEPYAEVRFNGSRLIFEGHTCPYPKDTMLCLYKRGIVEKLLESKRRTCYVWDWKK